MYNLCHDKYNWYYHTVPQENVNNRSFYWPRGRVYGGSSSLNAMVYVRGHAHDQNRWARECNDQEWNYDHVLPYFKRAQNFENGEDEYRGAQGPLHVSEGSIQNPLYQARVYTKPFYTRTFFVGWRFFIPKTFCIWSPDSGLENLQLAPTSGKINFPKEFKTDRI